jgi:tight adherence protein C
MMDASVVLLAATFITVVAGVSGLAFQLSKEPMAKRPRLGSRGLKRAKALEAGGIFALAEPTIRFVAVRLAILPSRARASLGRSLVRSGDYLGLSEDELSATCALSGVLLGTVSLLACRNLSLPKSLALVAFVLGTIAPWYRVLMVARTRAKSVGRALPGAVELAAMCMSAGLDFPGALRRIVDSAADPGAPIIEEFGRVLRELDLGHTRRRALEGFAERVPTDQVREFVNSVIQAEDKGNPLADVLTIQAQTQRMRRSIAAEEIASEAALMLIGPMTLIFLCVIALLLGPVVVRFMTGGLSPA